MAGEGLPPGFALDQQPDAPPEEPSQQPPSGFQLDEEAYGTPAQQAVTAAEGLSRGLLSAPVTAAAERGLTALGVPGLSPADQAARKEANPWTHGLSEAGGFGAGMLLGTGEAALVGKIGSAAAKGIEGASTISKIASMGVRTGAEMAALTAGDELAKTINQDPGQSLGTAAINIGLSGIIGGAGGAALGSVAPLWKASMEKMGVPKLIDDAKAQYGFRQSLPNGGDVPSAVTEELGSRISEMEAVHSNWDNWAKKTLEPAMPSVTPEASAKIDSQIQEIGSMMTEKIEKASENAYLKGSVPKLAQDFQDFLSGVTEPNATYAEKFQAINELKRAQWAKGKFSLTAEESALGKFTNSIGHDLSQMLEDKKVWGDAANVQKESNAAIKSFLDAHKAAKSKFTTMTADGLSASQDKVNTLVNQALKGRGIDKANAISEYLSKSEKLADTLNKIHTDAGLEAPVRLTPTPATNHVLGADPSAGTHLGNWLFDKGLATAAGHVGAESVGGGLGALIGHPALGAVIGDRMLAPAFTAIAKPLMETASHSEAFKASLDYVAQVIRGDKILSKATANVFKSGAEILPKDLIPNDDSKERLQKSIDKIAENPDYAMNIGGSVNHYLPNHGTMAAATAAIASNYLQSLKPTQSKNGPLDKPTPIDPMKQQKYDRALTIAQQPLMVLEYAKRGTLQLEDVKTLNTIYPQLHGKIVRQVYDAMTKAHADGTHIPYRQRVSLSLLMGSPLDSTLSQPGMAAISMANAPTGHQAEPQRRPGKVSPATVRAQEKVNSLYSSPSGAAATHRLER